MRTSLSSTHFGGAASRPLLNSPERRSDRRHREIREAAIGIFLANGYEGTTMEDIAVRAGVSKQTVYKHFTDKQTPLC